MKNQMKNAMLLLASAACAVSLVFTSVPVTTYAAQGEDNQYEWSSKEDSDGDSGSSEAEQEAGTVIAPSDIRITKGSAVGVDAAVYTNCSSWRLEWSVSGSAISVSGTERDTANLYAQQVGTSTVTIRLYGKSGTCLDSDYFNVYVSEPEPSYIKVNGISVNVQKMTLTAGETGRIRATVYPLNATNKDVNWSSSNTDIVSVDGDGLVRARKAGDATIYARSADSGDTATCKIHVTAANTRVAVSGIAVDSHDVSIRAGQYRDVNVRVTPSDAANKGFTASTSNASIAFVDARGIIYAVNNGICTITYRTNEGDYVSQVKVTVFGATTTQQLNTQTVQKAVSGSQTTTAAAKTATATTATGHDANIQFGYLQKIVAAASGTTVILHTAAPSAYDVNVLNAIKARPDVKVVAEFPFQGYEFHMVVPATFDATNLLVGGYVDWLTLCNYQAQGIQVTQIGAAQP